MASLKFELSEDKTSYAVVGVGLFGKNVEAVEIPREHKGLPVTEIGARAFYQLMKLRSVIIPDSVSAIGDYAFWRCFRLDEFTIPSSITSIGKYAFQYCDGLSSVTIPESVALIGENAFAGCGILTIHCDATEKPEGWSESWRGDTPVAWRDIPQNQRLEFKLNDSDGTYSVVGIGKFDGTELVIPEEHNGKPVRAIRKGNYDGCEGITSLRLHEGIDIVEEEVLSKFKGLTSIEVDEYNGDFKSVDGNLYTADGEKLVQYAPGKADRSFAVPSGVTSIGAYAFSGVSALEEVTIPVGVGAIGGWAFAHCGLKRVTVPGSVTKIGCSAFYSCEAMENVSLEEGVSNIAGSAFSGCLALTSINIPASVTYIDTSVFVRCYSLRSIQIDPDNPAYRMTDGVLYTKDGRSLLQYLAARQDTSFTVPEGVEVLEDYSFSCCKTLTAVSIGRGVTKIGRYAFFNCSGLTDIVIPVGVSTVEMLAFRFCNNLTINCEAEEKPAGWSEKWNGDRPMVWGYKGE